MPRYVYHKGREINDMFAVLTFYGVRALAFIMKNDNTGCEDTIILPGQILGLHEEDYRRSYDIIDFMEERYYDIFFEASFENYKCKYATSGYKFEDFVERDDPTELRKRFNNGYLYIGVKDNPHIYNIPECVIRELTELRKGYMSQKRNRSFNTVDVLCALLNEYIYRVVNNAAESGDPYFRNHRDTPRFSRVIRPFEYEVQRAMVVEYPDSIANCKRKYGSNLNRVLDAAMRDMYKQWAIDYANDSWMTIIRQSEHWGIWMTTDRNMDLTHSQTPAEMYYEYDCITPKFIDGRKVERNPEHDRYIKIVKDRHYAMRLIFEELDRDREQTLCKTSTPVDVYYENL